eukprot:scaffold7018_cov71-Attheya_sp.AAC.1
MRFSAFNSLFTIVAPGLLERAQEPEADDGVVVSAKCAAVILASTTTLGAGVVFTLTPAALCTAGFCAPGIAGSSFAAWWQSTLLLVAKGSLFVQLQAMAMGGVGVSSTVAGATVGEVLGATYLRDLCIFVDEADSESVMGHVFATSLTVVTTGIETKHTLQSKCVAQPCQRQELPRLNRFHRCGTVLRQAYQLLQNLFICNMRSSNSK